MEFIFCNTQYVAKTETSFSIKHSNYRPYVLDKNVISARQNISNTGHDFNKHAKFTLIQTI